MKDREKYLISEKETGTLGSKGSYLGIPLVKNQEAADPGTDNGSGDDKFGFKSYRESADVVNARNEMNNYIANKPADWTGGTYGAALNDAVNKILNRQPFSYDLNGDALYQQYKDQYINAGRLAMQDTIGQASSMTGGYGNSYAATAGNQAYQSQLQNLNNVIPDLYQLAYSVYNQEGQNLLNNYSTVQSAYDQEYSQYRDSVNDWYTEANRLANSYDSAYQKDYGEYTDAYNMALKNWQQNQSDKASVLQASTNSDYEKTISDLQGQLDNSITYDALNEADTQMKNFKSALMDERAFIDAKRNKWGGQYHTYKEYAEAMLKEWCDSGKLDEYATIKLMEELGL